MQSESEFMIGAAANRLIIIRPVHEKYHHSPFITVDCKIEAQPVLFFYLVVGIQHPEIVGFDIAPDSSMANDPIAKIRIQAKVVIVALLKVHSFGY